MEKIFAITTHAIEQFIRRWEPDKRSDQAAEELGALLRTSKAVGKTPHGHNIMVSGHRPEVRMVIKDRNVCVTVLPSASSWSEAMDFYEEEVLRMWEAHKEEMLQNIERYRQEYQTRSAQVKQKLMEVNVLIKEIDEERRMLGEQKTQLNIEIQDLKRELKEIERLNPDKEE